MYETLQFRMIFGSVDSLTNGNYFRAFLMNHAYVEREGCELSAKGAHVRGNFLLQGLPFFLRVTLDVPWITC